MKKIFNTLWCFVILLFFNFCLTSCGSELKTFSVSGYILSENGAIEGATISCEVGSVVSNSSGYYSFEGLISGVSIYVSHDDFYFPASVKTAFSDNDNLNFNGLEYYDVSGKIVSNENNPIPNASIVASGMIGCQTQSDVNGEFVLKNVVGKSSISVNKDGYQFETITTTINSNNSNLTFDGKTNVEVSINDEKNVIDNFNVLVDEKDIKVNGVGDTFNNIRIGTTFTPYKENFVFVPQSIVVLEENQKIDFEVFEKYSYSSTVLCGETPLGDVEIYLDDELVSKTNPQGVFSLTDLFGKHKLSFKLSGYIFEDILIDDEYLPEQINCTRRIIAQIYDETHNPIEGVEVYCNNNLVISDELGFVEINNAQIGDELEISKTGYFFESLLVDKAAISNIYGFKIYEANIIVKCGKKLLSGVELSLFGKTILTDTNGSAIFAGVYGSNEINVKSEKYKVISDDLVVSAERSELVIELAKYYDLEIEFDNVENIKVFYDNEELMFSNNKIELNSIYGSHSLLLKKSNFDDLNLIVNEDNCSIVNPQFSYGVDIKVLTDKIPVSDVNVIINDEIVGTTTKDGTLNISGLKGNVEISFEKEGCNFSQQEVSYYKELEVQCYYSLYGYVKVDKVAVSGVCLKLQKDLQTVLTAYTDKDGKYEFTNLNGMYSLYISDSDQYNKHFIEKGYSGLTSFGKYDFVNNSYKISGFVYSDNIPVCKVKVTAGDYVTYTDENGKYQFNSLSEEVNLVLEKEGYSFDGNTLVNDTLSEESVDFSAIYSITGKVISGDQVVKNVLIKHNELEVFCEDGMFNFSNLKGFNKFTFEKDNYCFEELNISEYCNLVVNSTYSVSGIVKTGEVCVAGVSVLCGKEKTQTDNDGKFVISGIIGSSKIEFEALNYNFIDATVNKPTNLEINCSYNISGYIKNNETPLANVQVLLNSKNQTTTNENGYFEINNLSGKNSIEYKFENFEFEIDEISEPFNKIIKASYSITGKILLNNLPMSGVKVSSGDKIVFTDSSGFYELKGLIGSGTLTVFKDGYNFSGEFKYSTATTLNFKALYSIKGVIKSGNTKLVGAIINCGGAQYLSNALGEFIIEDLDNEVVLTVSKDGYAYYGSELKFNDKAIDVEIQMGYEISGKVESTKDVAEVKVKLIQNENVVNELITDKTGVFKFEKVYGNSLVIFEKEGFAFDEYYYSKTTNNIIVKPTIVYKVTGKVMAGNFAISEAVIKAGSFGTFKTDSNGNFEIKNLSGTIVISAILSKSNCQTFTSNQISVSDNANLTLSFNINDYCYFVYEKGYQMLKENTYETSLSGTVELSVGGTQQVRGFKKKGADGSVLLEQLNYGKEILGIDPRMSLRAYYTPTNSNIVEYKTTKDVSTSYVPNYGSSWSSKTYNDFKNTYGLDIQGFFAYVINQSTISSITNVTKDTNGMSFRFVMNTSSSTVNYVKNMYAMSGQTPSGFNRIYINFYFNSNGEVIKSICDEQYTIKKGVTVTANGYLTETYKITNGATVIQKNA